MKKLILILILSQSSIFIGLGQNVIGNVYSVINIGTLDYSYIYNEQFSIFYKTTAYPSGLLNQSEQVQLKVDSTNSNEYNIQVIKNLDVITAFATKLKKENFNLPINSVYGMPVLENEILFFQNQDHFDEFYSILNDFSNSKFEERIDLLHLFENQFTGFTSFNRYLEETYDWENGEFTETEIDNRYKIDFLQDYVIKSICNKYAEVGIGNDIHVFLRENITNDCITIFINKNDAKNIDAIRLLNKDAKKIENLARLKDLIIAHGGSIIKTNKTKSITYILDNNNGKEIKLIYNDQPSFDNVNCSIFKKTFNLTIDRSCDSIELINTTNFSASVVINWGDGSSTNSIFPSFVGQTELNYSFISETHTYSTVGNYTITYSLTINSEHINSQISYHSGQTGIITVGSACGELYINAPSKRIWINGTYSMLCDAWINNWYAYRCVGSATEAWRKKNNGNLVKENGNIQCSITAVYRDNNCNIWENEYEYDEKYGKHVQTIVTKWWRKFDYSNGDTFSHNYYERNNAIVETSIPLNPCP